MELSNPRIDAFNLVFSFTIPSEVKGGTTTKEKIKAAILLNLMKTVCYVPIVSTILCGLSLHADAKNLTKNPKSLLEKMITVRAIIGVTSFGIGLLATDVLATLFLKPAFYAHQYFKNHNIKNLSAHRPQT